MDEELDWLDDDVAAQYWPEMVARLVDFGLPRSTAMRLVGQPHVMPEMLDRWLAYCCLRGRDSAHGTNAFLITRLVRNDFPAPSWGALRRLRERLAKKRQEEA